MAAPTLASRTRQHRCFGASLRAGVAGLMLGVACGGRTPLRAADVDAAWPADVADAGVAPGFRTGDRWVGEYTCTQGLTGLVLSVTAVEGNVVAAVFDFHHTPSGASGQYHLGGRYNAAHRAIELVPGEWIRRPDGYRSVGMSGVISADGATFEGRIMDSGCGNFSLRRRP